MHLFLKSIAAIERKVNDYIYPQPQEYVPKTTADKFSSAVAVLFIKPLLPPPICPTNELAIIILAIKPVLSFLKTFLLILFRFH